MALRLDIYPAEAVLPDGGIVSGARVMITRDERVVVWRDLTGVAKVAYAGRITDSGRYPERGAFWTDQRLTATTADGRLIVNQSGPALNCNCGGSSLSLLDEQSALGALAAVGE